MNKNLEKILLNIAYGLNVLIPKKQYQIFFYSSPDYSDNARALYEELLREDLGKKYSVVWAVKDFYKYTQKLKGVTVVKHRTVRNLWHFCRSKYLIRTHALWGNKYVQGRQVMCIAWHGMALKSMVLSSVNSTKVACDMITSTAPIFDKEICESMGLDVDKCKHVGLPRNDELFHNGHELEIMYPGFKKRIIWMPTFRKTSSYTDGVDTELGIPCIERSQLAKLNSILNDLNYLLILKLHHWSADKLSEICFSNIVNLKDSEIEENISLYRLLGQTDALITDYSSVSVDYLLINKPICFVYNDLDEYRKTRGFAFEPIENYMPGAKVNCFEELVQWFKNLELPDAYESKRKELKKIFFVYTDGNSSKRTLQELFKY